jgi:hypothetical protein
LANGRSQDDIEQMVRYYRQYAKGIYRVA